MLHAARQIPRSAEVSLSLAQQVSTIHPLDSSLVTFCTTDATPGSCDAACCEADTEKCGGLTITCAAGFYNPSSGFVTGDADASKNTPKAVMDAWKNLAANETNKNDNCCVAKAQCTNYTSAHIAAGITTTPAPVNYATTTPAAALKYSQHKIAVEQASSH